MTSGETAQTKAKLEPAGETRIADTVSAKELFKAVKSRNVQRVKELLDSGANPNVEDFFGWTPLHHAAFLGDREIVKLLLSKGADPNAFVPPVWSPDLSGTPADLARRKGYEDIAKLIEEQFKNESNSSKKSSLIDIIGMEQGDLRVGEWGSIKVVLKGDGEARLKIEGEVEWMADETYSIGEETAVEVAVKPKVGGKVPIRILVESGENRKAKFFWLNVGTETKVSLKNVEEAVRYRVYLTTLDEMYKRGEVKGEVYRRLKEEYEKKLKELEGS